MFDSNHYMPILRWKAAEREALGNLKATEKHIITPMLEILMPKPKEIKYNNGKPKTPAELLAESVFLFQNKVPVIPREILKYWGKDRLFLDLNLIDTSVIQEGLDVILSDGRNLDICIIPVVNFSSGPAIQNKLISLAKRSDHGICLRLSRIDIGQASMPMAINKFLKTHAVSMKDIDLLVDLKITDNQYADLIKFVSNIPNISKWRTFTVASGAFPPDLTHLSVDLHKIPRSDWSQWLSIALPGLKKRKPSFADYTIQYPIYREPVRGANPSASIRYALKMEWLIMRGQGLRSKKSAGHAQYPAQAQLLSKRPEFFGADFSEGDNYIAEIGKNIKTKKTGNPKTWLRAGINHHLVCVASQIANLS